MYLYGDCTESHLDSNVLGVLPDALDYCVGTILADERIARAREQCREAERLAAHEIGCLETLAARLKETLAHAPTGAEGGQTAEFVTTLGATFDVALNAEVDSVGAQLRRTTKLLGDGMQAERTACLTVLERLLIRHDLPGASSSIHLHARDDGSYAARLHGRTPFGLRWTLELDTTGEALFEHVVRIDRLVRQLEFHAPRMSGWIHKTPGVQLVHLEHHQIAELELSTERMKLFLTNGGSRRGPVEGVHLELLPEAPFARAWRSDAADEPVVLEGSDRDLLGALHEKLVAVAGPLAARRKRLVEASLDDVPLLDQPSPRIVGERLVAAMAPITKGIVEHSGARGELVLKRVLDGHRREEIFLSRADLLARMASLTPEQQTIFEPLGLSGPEGDDVQSRRRAEEQTVSWASPGAVAIDGAAVVAIARGTLN